MAGGELVAREPQALMRMDPSELIARAIDKGADVETMERLVALAKDMRAEIARDAWYTAMAEFQATCPSIRKTKKAQIATARGAYAYTYAPLDEILGVVQPVMGSLGFSVSWRQKMEPDRVVIACRVSHVAGHHEESGDIAIPIVTADPERGATPAQRVGIATTYAKRYTLLGIIGLAPEDDPDSRKGPGSQTTPRESGSEPAAGAAPDGVITEPQVRKFHAIARGKWSDEQIHGLLTAFKCTAVAEIQARDYDAILDTLKAGPPA